MAPLCGSTSRVKQTDALIAMLLRDVFTLADAGIGSVVVGPPQLRGEVYRHFIDRFANFHFHGAADFTDEKGLAFLDGVLERRGLEEVLPSAPRRLVAEFSGGILRDLISLARSAAEICYTSGGDQITKALVGAAAEKLGRTLLLGVPDEVIKRLVGLRRTTHSRGDFVDFTAATDSDIDLLIRRLVIELLGVPSRFTIHPTVKLVLRGLQRRP